MKHLKSCHPDIKVGGPAFCHSKNDEYNHALFDALKAAGVTIDFYSFHGYYAEPSAYMSAGQHAYDLVCEYGVEDKTELILDEWNYVRRWTGEGFVHSVHAIHGLKGSSFIAGAMAVGQKSKIDMLMYYDARLCSWNGMFDIILLTPKKGYYPFKMYGEMYRLGTEIETISDDEHVYAVGATDGKTSAVMLTYFDDDDNAAEKDIEIELAGLGDGEKKIEYFVLDEKHDDELFRTDLTSASSVRTTFKTKPYTTYFIRITK